MKLLIQILLVIIPSIVFAQFEPYLAEPNKKEAMQLRMVFETTSNDTMLMEVSRKLGFYYHERNTDSALFFQTQQLQLARSLAFSLWEADALELCGFISRLKGQYPGSLRYFQEALRITENPKSERNSWRPEVLSLAGTPSAARLSVRAWTFLDMAGLYGRIGNDDKAMTSYRKSISLASALNDDILLSLSYGSYGSAFMDRKVLDSALYYLQLELKYTKKSGYDKYLGSAFKNLALIYLQQEDYENSIIYFDKAIRSAKETANERSLGGTYIDLSELFLKTNQLDSSLFYARKGLNISQNARLPQLALLANKMLNRVFARKGNIDSAYLYQSAAIALADSIFSEEKVIHMQNLEFSEQQRIDELSKEKEKYQNKIKTRALLSGLFLILIIAGIMYRNSRIRRKAYKLLSKQRNELQNTLAELENTQTQLIHAEKMASLGELTAGIAHEIQNPLNFVNNFSDLSVDLVDEMNDEIDSGETAEVKAIAGDLKQNLELISHHGQRASFIVKGMLEHSRSSTGEKKPTDINGMAEEFLKLSYHGLRAKDKSFNADFEIKFEKDLPLVNVVAQDIGRVLLNLINNAFYAVAERKKEQVVDYEPMVTLITDKKDDQLVIKVIDNGNGIPEKVKKKIFQPFFTTKPTGEGTGLGLSLSYDIITKGHGGELKVETEEGVGTSFIIRLPIS